MWDSRWQAGNHPLGLADILRERYPKVRWQPEQFVTEDGRLFCSGGVYASIDLSLYLVEKFCGHEVALQCAKALLLSMPRGRQAGYSVVQLSRPHSDQKIRQTEEYLQQHFDRDISIDNLAKKLHHAAG
jgi:transcriptional regulator GlxA family with amidase domain